MSRVAEFKTAAERLSAEDRWELYRWLAESRDVQQFRHEELRHEIALGLQEADRRDLAPMDVSTVKDEVRRRLAAKASNADGPANEPGAPRSRTGLSPFFAEDLAFIAQGRPLRCKKGLIYRKIERVIGG